MTNRPKLVPTPPTSGEPIAIDRSPFWIGSGAGSSLRDDGPGIAERHASVTEQDDGFYLSPFPRAAQPRVNGRPVTGPVKLGDGYLIELGPRSKWEFVTGAPRAKSVEPVAAAPRAVTPPPARVGPVGPTPPFPPGVEIRRPASRSAAARFLGLAAAILLVTAGGYWAFRTFLPPAEVEAAFGEQEGQLYDSLLVESTKSIERGSTLLDLGLRDAALQEFVKAIVTFEASVIGTSKYVRPTIDALIGAIQDIYRHGRVDAPSRFAATTGRKIDLSKNLGVQLSVSQFAAAVDRVGARFRGRFGRGLEITGADHPEHVSLYGPGGALDIRVRNLSDSQIGFLISGFGTEGVRVKDFSQDAVLQAQIAAAIAAGLADRAGTGRHLHIDRFRDRRDRWTVTALVQPKAASTSIRAPTD